jgi:RNA polymerase sigma-70 factor (ECF subfamily)
MRVREAPSGEGRLETGGAARRAASCHACRPAASVCRARCRAFVRQAGAGEDAPARAALAEVIQGCWKPVHALVRRAGLRGPDAEDLTQAYFAHFLEKGYIRAAASWTGCLRPFVRTTVRHFLSNQRDHERAAKRGGGLLPVSLDALAEKGWAPPSLQHRGTPETLLERRRVAAALIRAIRRLTEEHQASGRGDRFARLIACLLDGGATRGYAALAAEWSVGESAVRVAVHRLRRRLAEVLGEAAESPRVSTNDRRILVSAARGTGSPAAWERAGGRNGAS